MSVDRTSQEYHLTPEGWIIGSYSYYGKVQGETVVRPKDAVETWSLESEQSSVYSDDVYWWKLVWYDSSISEEDRKRLRIKFPELSHNFPG